MFPNKLIVIILVLTLFSCSTPKKTDFKISLLNQKELNSSQDLKLKVLNPKDYAVNSVVVRFLEQEVETEADTDITLHLENAKLGTHTLHADIDVDGERIHLKQSVIVHHDKKPDFYSYEITNTFPHDIKAYTQGLEFYNDTLYESTGMRGRSSLRKLDYETGKVYDQINLDDYYFGEGITFIDDRIIQLTYQAEEGLIYDADKFERTGKFKYNQSKEGWGLCYDGKWLYKTDGSDKIWRLDPETLEEVDYFQAVTNSTVLKGLNELEYVNGKIYANTYLKDGVVIFDPKTGAVEGLIDLRGLKSKVTKHPELDVLNGIAYYPKTEKFYVTGKNWDKLFEIELSKK